MKNEELVIEILGNRSSREILSLTSKMECSAIQLCHELGIPLTTVYRKLKLLEDRGMLDVSLQMENYSDKIVRLWKRFAIPDATELGIQTI